MFIGGKNASQQEDNQAAALASAPKGPEDWIPFFNRIHWHSYTVSIDLKFGQELLQHEPPLGDEDAFSPHGLVDVDLFGATWQIDFFYWRSQNTLQKILMSASSDAAPSHQELDGSYAEVLAGLEAYFAQPGTVQPDPGNGIASARRWQTHSTAVLLTRSAEETEPGMWITLSPLQAQQADVDTE